MPSHTFVSVYAPLRRKFGPVHESCGLIPAGHGEKLLWSDAPSEIFAWPTLVNGTVAPYAMVSLKSRFAYGSASAGVHVNAFG